MFLTSHHSATHGSTPVKVLSVIEDEIIYINGKRSIAVYGKKMIFRNGQIVCDDFKIRIDWVRIYFQLFYLRLL
jgi:hypothetical protein